MDILSNADQRPAHINGTQQNAVNPCKVAPIYWLPRPHCPDADLARDPCVMWEP